MSTHEGCPDLAHIAYLTELDMHRRAVWNLISGQKHVVSTLLELHRFHQKSLIITQGKLKESSWNQLPGQSLLPA